MRRWKKCADGERSASLRTPGGNEQFMDNITVVIFMNHHLLKIILIIMADIRSNNMLMRGNLHMNEVGFDEQMQ